jgi:hypothetical protein
MANFLYLDYLLVNKNLKNTFIGKIIHTCKCVFYTKLKYHMNTLIFKLGNCKKRKLTVRATDVLNIPQKFTTPVGNGKGLFTS